MFATKWVAPAEGDTYATVARALGVSKPHHANRRSSLKLTGAPPCSYDLDRWKSELDMRGESPIRRF